MRKRKLKKSVISVFVGLALGLLLSQITSRMSLQDSLLLSTVLLIFVIVIVLIMAEDLEAKIKRAYKDGRASMILPIHQIYDEDK